MFQMELFLEEVMLGVALQTRMYYADDLQALVEPF